ncbi:MAG TPA: Gfo/Idh/MocA family oxidoreductase [Acidobacteriota bacterium]|nr:Gfo/Idh/MocA family oxidoreductase [Acidobacteriota bacterium]
MIKVGIIGMGIRGNLYATTVKYNAFAEVTGFAEGNPERLRAAKERFSGEAYEDYSRMLEEKRFDIVIVALPDHLHKDAVIKAASSGCNLLIEKPLATSYEDAKTMVKAIKEAGVKALVGYENRWSPVFITAKEAVAAGELKDIQLIQAKLNDSIWVPTKMLSWTTGSSVGWFLMPHTVDLALWLSGQKAISVHAVGQKKVLAKMGIDTFDSITATVVFESGMVGTFSSSWIYPESIPLIYDMRLEVLGSDGALEVDLRDQNIHKMTNRYSHPPTLGRDIYGKPVGFAAEMLNSFIDNVKDATEPLVDLEDALTGVNIVDTIHRAVVSGGILKVEE